MIQCGEDCICRVCLYSAYSPVYDSNLAFVFSLGISAIIVTRFRKSFMHLYKKMNDLSDGIETLVHEVAPESETEDYMEVFNRADTAMYADKRAFYQMHQDRRNKESEHK